MGTLDRMFAELAPSSDTLTTSGTLPSSDTLTSSDTLSSSDTGEAAVPATVTIDAGQTTSAPFTITGVDDFVVDGTQTVTVLATAAAHPDGSDTVDLTDD